MCNKALTVIIVGVLGALAWAQPAPMGPGGMPGMVRPVSPERLVTALSQEMDWLIGLSIDAPGWDKALSALQGAVEELQASQGAPSPELVIRASAALHLVVDILQREAFQHALGRVREARQGSPEWLEGYLDEATAGMELEEAARVRAIVVGLLQGMRSQVGKPVRERLAERGRMGVQPGQGCERGPFAGPAGPAAQARQKLPPQVESWIKGYLAGATAGMSGQEAAQVRQICWGAIKAGRDFHQEMQAERRENLEHFLHLRRITAGLDLLFLRETAGQ